MCGSVCVRYCVCGGVRGSVCAVMCAIAQWCTRVTGNTSHISLKTIGGYSFVARRYSPTTRDNLPPSCDNLPPRELIVFHVIIRLRSGAYATSAGQYGRGHSMSATPTGSLPWLCISIGWLGLLYSDTPHVVYSLAFHYCKSS